MARSMFAKIETDSRRGIIALHAQMQILTCEVLDKCKHSNTIPDTIHADWISFLCNTKEEKNDLPLQ